MIICADCHVWVWQCSWGLGHAQAEAQMINPAVSASLQTRRYAPCCAHHLVRCGDPAAAPVHACHMLREERLLASMQAAVNPARGSAQHQPRAAACCVRAALHLSYCHHRSTSCAGSEWCEQVAMCLYFVVQHEGMRRVSMRPSQA